MKTRMLRVIGRITGSHNRRELERIHQRLDEMETLLRNACERIAVDTEASHSLVIALSNLVDDALDADKRRVRSGS